MSEATPAASSRSRSPSNRRRAFRVRTHLPIRIRPLTAGELTREERDFGAREAMPVPRDPAVAVWLRRIEAKLDRLCAEVIPGSAAVELPPGPAERREVDLSSVGVRFAGDGTLREGADVLVECLVPGDLPRPIRMLARVARVSGSGTEERVALDFRRITGPDQDALVRFTQDVQRCASF